MNNQLRRQQQQQQQPSATQRAYHRGQQQHRQQQQHFTNSTSSSLHHQSDHHNNHHQSYHHHHHHQGRQRSVNFSLSICYSYLIAILSSFLVVLGVYLSLTRFNVHFLYISLAGLLIEAISAFAYCISNIHASKLAQRKQTSDESILENVNSVTDRRPVVLTRQQQARNVTHILTNRTLNQSVIPATIDNNNSNNIENNSNGNDSVTTSTASNNTTTATSQLTPIEPDTSNNSTNNDNNSSNTDNLNRALDHHNGEQTSGVATPDTILVGSQQPRGRDSNETLTRSRDRPDSSVILMPSPPTSQSMREQDNSNSNANTKLEVVSSTPVTEELVVVSDSVPLVVNQVKTISPLSSSSSADNDDQLVSITNRPVDLTMNEVNQSQLDIDTQSLQAVTPSAPSAASEIRSGVQRGVLSPSLDSSRTPRQRANLRRTLVMGLSGEEEVIEINEDDLDNMSILPPPYESILSAENHTNTQQQQSNIQ